ncbi:MAG TPA: GNAT family N-acetyltransferase [Solirubrobacteraceae bacterium]|jgi:GNAT superfamily N-acetyltransferase|nr:GNAT family N-acetyltransferase [Solirubrobacteraceae bacterium]
MPVSEAAEPLVVRPARPEDVPLLLALLRELAEYERLADEVMATEELFHEALFSERPAAEALIAERGEEPVGYALFFSTFSTFLAIQGIWLEDLFVRPDQRKSGAGKALLAAVAARARERGAERLEWSALKWNELALGFYRSLGAQRMDEWVTHRLVGEELRSLAAETDARG